VKYNDVAVAVSRGKGGIYLNVHAQPGARKEQPRGMHGQAVKIALREAAQDGKANKSLIALLARELALPRQCVQIVSGRTSRTKRVFIRGEVDELMQQLVIWLSHA